MAYARRKERDGNGTYACATYRRYGKSYCSMHYITYNDLYNLVLEDIKKHSKSANIDTEQLLSDIIQTNEHKYNKNLSQSKREIMKFEKRLEEVNVIIKRLYEDNVLGKITDERFSVLLNDYEIEQRSIRDNIIEVRDSMNDLLEEKDNSNRFTNIIQKYTDIKELNATILNEMI